MHGERLLRDDDQQNSRRQPAYDSCFSCCSRFITPLPLFINQNGREIGQRLSSLTSAQMAPALLARQGGFGHHQRASSSPASPAAL
jgi:hypothetical protein